MGADHETAQQRGQQTGAHQGRFAASGSPHHRQETCSSQLGNQLLALAIAAKEEMTDALSIPTDRKSQKSIDAAQDMIKEEKWGEAASIRIPSAVRPLLSRDRCSTEASRGEAARAAIHLLPGLSPDRVNLEPAPRYGELARAVYSASGEAQARASSAQQAAALRGLATRLGLADVRVVGCRVNVKAGIGDVAYRKRVWNARRWRESAELVVNYLLAATGVEARQTDL